MLKITLIDGPHEQRLVLEGRLAEPDLSTLKSVWEDVYAALGTRQCIVDLRGATIDRSSEGVLLDMKQKGARFVACGVSTTHHLRRLGIRCRGGIAKLCL